VPSRRDPKQPGSDGPGEPCPPGRWGFQGTVLARSSPRWPRSGCQGRSAQRPASGPCERAPRPRASLSQSRGAVASRAGACPEEARGSPGWKPGLPRAAGPEGQARGPDGRFGEKPCRTERAPLASFGSGFCQDPEAGLLEFLGPRATSLCPDQHRPCSACPSRVVPRPPMASAVQTLASLVEGGTEVGVAGPLLSPRLGLLLFSQQHKLPGRMSPRPGRGMSE